MELKSKEVKIALVVCLVVVFFYMFPIWSTFSNSANNFDSDITLSKLYSQLVSIKDFKEFPFFNPYICGGIPAFAHPHNSFFPLQWLIYLLFGLLKGIKISIFLYLAFGALGMYVFSRKLGANPLGGAAASTIFIGSSYFSYRIAMGVVYPITAAFVPWIFLCFILSLKEKKYLIPTAILLAWAFLEDVPYIFLYTLLFLIIYTLWECISRRDWRPLVLFIILGIMMGGLVAVKLLPMYSLYGSIKRIYILGDKDGIPYQYLPDVFLNKEHAKEDWDPVYYRLEPELELHADITNYLGLLPLIFFIFGLFLLPKKTKRFFWMGIICLFIIMGIYSPIPVYQFIHMFPLYKSISRPFRVLFVLNVFIGLVVSLVLTRLCRMKIALGGRKKRLKPVVFILALFMMLNILFVNSQAFEKAFRDPPIDETFQKQNDFVTVGNKDGFVWNFNTFPHMIQNKGMRECNLENMIKDTGRIVPKEFVLEPENVRANYQQRPVLVNTGEGLSAHWLVAREIMQFMETNWTMHKQQIRLQILFPDNQNQFAWAFPQGQQQKVVYLPHTIAGITFADNASSKSVTFTRGNISQARKIGFPAQFQKQDNSFIGITNQFVVILPFVDKLPFTGGQIILHKNEGDPWILPNPSYTGEINLDHEGSIQKIYWSPNKREYKINAEEDTIVTLNQVYIPGWKLHIDGKEAEIIPQDDLISFPILAGSHIVRLRYQAEFFYLGLFLTLVMLGLLLFSWKKPSTLKFLNFLYK